jgi:3-dehydro-L-gulonate 2-dehydrogenase
MDRAIALASEHGLGCVALRNTNHWMRAGTYAWQAAEAGCPAICFTNTEPNLPPWGGTRPVLGNNPIALAIPRTGGRHLLFDGALSQFSYGAMEDAARRGRTLSVPGGFDRNGELTRDPAEIVASQRPLPVGFWKGAGLSLLLDLFAAVLSSGATTRELGERRGEYGVSQAFLAFHGDLLGPSEESVVDATLAQLLRVETDGVTSVTYPGLRLHERRAENLELGVPVDAGVWQRIQRACGDT